MSRPEVLLLALCENAELDETGEPTLEGVFHRIGFHRLPAAKERVVIAVELWGTPSETVDLVLRLVGPSYPDSATLPPFPVAIPEKAALHARPAHAYPAAPVSTRLDPGENGAGLPSRSPNDADLDAAAR